MNFEKKNDLVCIEIEIMDLNSDILRHFLKRTYQIVKFGIQIISSQ